MIDLVDKTPMVDEIKNASVEDLFSSLSTDDSKGLNSQEVKNRLKNMVTTRLKKKR